MNAAALVRALAGVRLPCHDEKVLQAAIADELAKQGIAHSREVAVEGGFIDLLVEDVGIEVKIDGSARQIFRQLKRYAEDARIAEFVLVTNKAVIMPRMVLDKPCHMLSVGRAWL